MKGVMPTVAVCVAWMALLCSPCITYSTALSNTAATIDWTTLTFSGVDVLWLELESASAVLPATLGQIKAAFTD